MNPKITWALIAVAFVIASMTYGWHGAALVGSCTVFVMLLQLNRAMKILQRTAKAPKGMVGSVVMLQSKLQAGMPLLKVLAMTGSIGLPREATAPQEIWAWQDAGGTELTLTFDNGKLSQWHLTRHQDEATTQVSAN